MLIPSILTNQIVCSLTIYISYSISWYFENFDLLIWVDYMPEVTRKRNNKPPINNWKPMALKPNQPINQSIKMPASSRALYSYKSVEACWVVTLIPWRERAAVTGTFIKVCWLPVCYFEHNMQSGNPSPEVALRKLHVYSTERALWCQEIEQTGYASVSMEVHDTFSDCIIFLFPTLKTVNFMFIGL